MDPPPPADAADALSLLLSRLDPSSEEARLLQQGMDEGLKVQRAMQRQHTKLLQDELDLSQATQQEERDRLRALKEEHMREMETKDGQLDELRRARDNLLASAERKSGEGAGSAAADTDGAAAASALGGARASLLGAPTISGDMASGLGDTSALPADAITVLRMVEELRPFLEQGIAAAAEAAAAAAVEAAGDDGDSGSNSAVAATDSSPVLISLGAISSYIRELCAAVDEQDRAKQKLALAELEMSAAAQEGERDRVQAVQKRHHSEVRAMKDALQGATEGTEEQDVPGEHGVGWVGLFVRNNWQTLKMKDDGTEGKSIAQSRCICIRRTLW